MAFQQLDQPTCAQRLARYIPRQHCDAVARHRGGTQCLVVMRDEPGADVDAELALGALEAPRRAQRLEEQAVMIFEIVRMRGSSAPLQILGRCAQNLLERVQRYVEYTFVAARGVP